MLDSSSISRRHALLAAGGIAVGTSGYVTGVRSADVAPSWLTGRDCDPSPLVTNPTDWPFPRYDRANTRHAPERAGPDWPLERTWEYEWPVGDVYELRSLVVANGLVVVLIEAGIRSTLLAISLADRQVRWRRPVEGGTDGHVFAAGGTAFVEGAVPDTSVRVAVRSLADGSAVWTGSTGTHGVRTLAGGRLLALEHSPDRRRDDKHFAITAYDARTGDKCWRAVYDGWAGDIAVADGQLIVPLVLPTDDLGTLALDPASGERQWRADAGGGTAAVADGRAIVERFPGELSAVSLADGSVEWQIRSEHFTEDGTDDDGRRIARPSFDVGAVTPEAVVYALDVHSDYPNRLRARDPETGDLLWDVGPEPTPDADHGYVRPIAVGDDVLAVRYARNDDGEPDALLRLDVATGTERDRLTVPADEHVSTPVVADGTLLVPTDERLIAYQ